MSTEMRQINATGEKERLFWIDYARGLGLILVVLAHSQLPFKIFEIISYIIVIFPFISGYLYKEMNLKEFFKKRIPLIYSYYYIGFIGLVLWIFLVPVELKKADNLSYVINYIFVRTVDMDSVPLTIVPLWYLFFLFLAEFVYQVSNKFNILYYVIALGIAKRFIEFEIHSFKIGVALSGLYMFHLGRVFKEKNVRINNTVGIMSFFGWVIIGWLFGETGWNVDYYGKNAIGTFFVIIGEIFCAMFFYWFAKILEKAVNQKGFLHVVSVYITKFLKEFSDNAIFVLGYHITIGGVIFVLLRIFGLNVSIETVSKYWYITFLFMIASVYLLIKCLPKPVKLFLTQPDAFLKSIRKNKA
ncbi:MAG: acyltransferase family protein [Fervidobacterium sp.]|uniref:acyltransferase family protein n=1 Tax=Fervidobacterium sp. TaxID=1871331 RepID=UPI00404A859D